MTNLRFALTVRQPPDVVFGVIADIGRYARWLPGSGTYTGVATTSPGPVEVGTTYTDRGPFSAMRGEVTEFAPSAAIAFRQELRTAPLPGGFTIQMQYQLRATDEDATYVERTVSIRAAGVLHKLAQPVLVYTSRRESWRIMRALQRYLATSPPSS